MAETLAEIACSKGSQLRDWKPPVAALPVCSSVGRDGRGGGARSERGAALPA
jgi:hypothetical protein